MRISEENFLELLDKNAVKYGIVDGNFEILDDGENVQFYKQYIEDTSSRIKLFELVQARELSNAEQIESEQVSAKALEVWQRLRKWLTQYGNLNESKLTLEMMMAELERQNAPIFELDLKIYLRELVASGYVKVHREYRERLGRPAAVTTYYVIEHCTKAFDTRAKA